MMPPVLEKEDPYVLFDMLRKFTGSADDAKRAVQVLFEKHKALAANYTKIHELYKAALVDKDNYAELCREQVAKLKLLEAERDAAVADHLHIAEQMRVLEEEHTALAAQSSKIINEMEVENKRLTVELRAIKPLTEKRSRYS
jgi:phosphoserine phosphatase